MTRTLCLFAGVGGTAKGARDAGHEVIMVEREPVAVATLRANFPESLVIQADVKLINWVAFRNEHGPIDVLEGGPPCQPFSQGGLQSGEYDLRDCIPDFIDAARILQPRIFVMENVWTLTWKKNEAYFIKFMDDMVSAGYRVQFRVIRMDRHGLPQSRKRLFVVGIRKDLNRSVAWPEEIPGVVTMAEALEWSETEAVMRASRAPGEYAYPGWVFTRASTTVVGSFRPEVQAAPGYRKAGDRPRQYTPGSVVTTLEEALVLQGLPRDWIVAGHEAQQRLQVGNACPPAMMRKIVEANL